jgi:prepilin-type N-terminal cleavage/methylation domain-containing protein/prepilin-type processing-associated H-X9-DG protein
MKNWNIRNMARPWTRAAGFTLTELLVVIAILGLLAALLLSSLGRAFALSRRMSCMNKLHQWNLALRMYADDNAGSTPRESFIPGGTRINLWTQIFHGLANDVWYNALPEYAIQRRAAYYAPSIAAREDFHRQSNLFHCPSTSFPKEASRQDFAYFSIAMNSKLILRPDLTMKLSSIESPSATVTFLEGRLPGEPKADPSQRDDHRDPDLGQPSVFATRFVTRHQQRGNLAFADGHQEPVYARDVLSNGVAIVPQRRIIWTADPAIDPNILE